MNNTNNYEVTIKITGFEFDEETGCSIQEISVTSKGEFGDKFAALCVSGLTKMTEMFTPSPTPAPVAEEANFTEVPTTPNKIETHWDLPAIWSVMMAKLPEGFEKAGVGCYTYKKDEATETNIRKTTIRLLFKDESIDMNIRSGDAQAYFYLYGNAERSWFNGINPALIDELINELPDDVKEFVRNFVKKVLNK